MILSNGHMIHVSCESCKYAVSLAIRIGQQLYVIIIRPYLNLITFLLDA